ncbi:class I SAM-dependent methyltransferase [Streptomyces maremycinicus]|uniref:class I SAM-dependent methyltransferase n=1 Tax=Streptomyces maremycinicus TaxID=1679753 RepID=UPI00278C3BDE|nr:class I SAM-dependent methyltransferase [Streptomyces sp. NBRC 110468]
MPDEGFLAATRASYDVMAVEYAEKVDSDLDVKPLDRAPLAAFAELTQASGNGPVADLGCGPGQVTAALHRLGLNAFGIDPSPGMIVVARRTYPDLSFEVGSMPALDPPQASLGGCSLTTRSSTSHGNDERRCSSSFTGCWHRVGS